MRRRLYLCELGHKFTHYCEKNDPDPECPECKIVASIDEAAEHEEGEARIREMVASGKAPGIMTVKSKAMDYAQKMAEDDYGLTNMNDGGRAGEAAFKPEGPMSNAQAIEQAREMMAPIAAAQTGLTPTPAPMVQAGFAKDPINAFWAGGGAVQGAPGPVHGAPASVQQSAPAAQETRNSGFDPVEKLHAAGKAGMIPNQNVVVAKAPMPTGVGL